MAALAFDTHEFVKELKEAGFSEQQAEALIELQKAASKDILNFAKALRLEKTKPHEAGL